MSIIVSVRGSITNATPTNIAAPVGSSSISAKTILSQMIIAVFIVVLEGWDDYIVEGKEAPDEEQCSD